MKIEALIERITNDRFAANLDYQNEQIELNVKIINFEGLSKFKELINDVEERLHRG